jgi:hypothetical protein
MKLSADARRSALFWKDYDKERLSDPTVLTDRVMSLYGSGPRCGGMCRSDVAVAMGLDFHFVDRIIKEGMRERKRHARR